MKIKDLTKEELEAMSYDDIAFKILTESKKKMKINELFKKVCDTLDLSERVFEEKIADFFEVLSTDQRFIMLKEGFWDLKSRHTVNNIVIDEEDEEDVLDTVLEEQDDFEEEQEDNVYYEEDETEDQTEDDLKDLVIIDDEDGSGLE